VKDPMEMTEPEAGTAPGASDWALQGPCWLYRRHDVDSGITGRGNELVAVAPTDVLSDGLSMVYSFFEPSEEIRSLGTFMILDRIARARRQGLPYVYLGYWIEGSKKMDYKGRFLPQQRLAASGWLRVDAAGDVSEPQD
jgi:leucyl-tRNA---protein transferase